MKGGRQHYNKTQNIEESRGNNTNAGGLLPQSRALNTGGV